MFIFTDLTRELAATSITMSTSGFNLEKFLIPLEEIERATNSFSSETYIGEGTFGKVYRGQLSERWENCTVAIKRLVSNETQGIDEFRRELKMISDCHHQNIIRFIGYCDEGNEMIIVSEYASNGSLDDHLEDPDKIRCIKWADRLKICLGVARGLRHLHSGLGDDSRIIHRDLKSGNILLHENMEAKICDFGLSRACPRNQPHTKVYTEAGGTQFYMDPYTHTGILRKESDFYSFGVVLFEMLSGTPAYQRSSYGDGKQQYLINRIHWLVHDYSVDRLDDLIDPHIRDHIDMQSSGIFIEIAYQCIGLDYRKRPTINRIIERIKEALEIQNHRDRAVSSITIQRKAMSSSEVNLEKFLIPLEEINRATNSFSIETNYIGEGSYGKVYRGQLSERWENCTVAIKRLVSNETQGKDEFRRELKMISECNHQNIIRFIGYCDEGNEMIIVSEYASNGGLDNHLEDPNKIRCITWAQRLKICLGVARGLRHLHSGVGDDNRVIHRDVKSGNILLNDNMEAKICDLGFSRSGPRNQPHTHVYADAGGNNFYMDPIYSESGILRKESDVYSFGVILFEMLSGTPVYQRRSYGDGKEQDLINLVRQLVHRYSVDRLDDLIDPHIRYQVDMRSSRIFKKIAYQCISLEFKKLPTMARVVKRIKEALNIQKYGDASTRTIQSDQYQKTMSFSGLNLEKFGNIYIRLPSVRWQNHTAAIKRLDQKYRDVKSGNRLLDDNLEASNCDFGSSILCTRDQPYGSVLPEFVSTTFEMFSGRLAYQRSYGDDKKQYLIDVVRRYYNNGMDKLIDPHKKDHISSGSSDMFKEVAYKGISLNLKERPMMDYIIKMNRKALNTQETVSALIECLMKDIGFSQGKPVAAFTIYKCLLHWKSFEAERTIVFDQLVNMFDLAIEKEDTNDHKAYWLSNVSALLFLIQGSQKPDDASSMGFHLSPSSASVAEAAAATEVVEAVAEYTALSFKQKLTEYVEYMYDIIRDNLKEELGSLLPLCIQSPRKPRRVQRPGHSVGKDPESNHWQGIVDCLNTLLNTLKKNFVPPVIVEKIFSQLFSYINAQVFHSILLYRECCTFRNGEYVETGLIKLQQWCRQAKEEYVNSAMEKLKHLRQAVTLLVTLNEKHAKKSFVEISEEICPSLSLQQLYRICTIYRDENNNIPDVTKHVISSIKMRWTKDFKNEDINSFVLEDYSSEPFSIDELFTSLQVEDFAGVEPPSELAKYSALHFLYD